MALTEGKLFSQGIKWSPYYLHFFEANSIQNASKDDVTTTKEKVECSPFY